MQFGLKALAAYDITKRTTSYYASFFNDLVRSVIDMFSGDQEMWYFYDEFSLPIQAAAVATDNRDIMCWTYLKRSKQFIHRCGAVANKKIDYPWLSATLVVPSYYEDEEPHKCDFSAFLEENDIYCNRKVIPPPNMLLSAWSVQNRRWLTHKQRRGAYFEVITAEGEDMKVPAWIHSVEAYNIWLESVGSEYAADAHETAANASDDDTSEDEIEEAQIAPEPEPEPEASAPPTESKKTN